MAILSFLYQILITGIILVGTIIAGIEQGPIFYLIGGVCLVVYYVAYSVSADFSLSPRDYWKCNRWSIFIKKTGWAISTTIIVMIVILAILKSYGVNIPGF